LSFLPSRAARHSVRYSLGHAGYFLKSNHVLLMLSSVSTKLFKSIWQFAIAHALPVRRFLALYFWRDLLTPGKHFPSPTDYAGLLETFPFANRLCWASRYKSFSANHAPTALTPPFTFTPQDVCRSPGARQDRVHHPQHSDERPSDRVPDPQTGGPGGLLEGERCEHTPHRPVQGGQLLRV
jgi:hypothetical protein